MIIDIPKKPTETVKKAEYRTMRAIGDPWDLTSFQLGQILMEKGYRLDNGNPSWKSIINGYAQAYRLDCGLIAYRWDRGFVDGVVRDHLAKGK